MADTGNYNFLLVGPDADKWQEWLKFADSLEKNYGLISYGDYVGHKNYVDYGYSDGVVYWEVQWDCPPEAALEIDTFFRRKFGSK